MVVISLDDVSSVCLSPRSNPRRFEFAGYENVVAVNVVASDFATVDTVVCVCVVVWVVVVVFLVVLVVFLVLVVVFLVALVVVNLVASVVADVLVAAVLGTEVLMPVGLDVVNVVIVVDSPQHSLTVQAFNRHFFVETDAVGNPAFVQMMPAASAQEACE